MELRDRVLRSSLPYPKVLEGLFEYLYFGAAFALLLAGVLAVRIQLGMNEDLHRMLPEAGLEYAPPTSFTLEDAKLARESADPVLRAWDVTEIKAYEPGGRAVTVFVHQRDAAALIAEIAKGPVTLSPSLVAQSYLMHPDVLAHLNWMKRNPLPILLRNFAFQLAHAVLALAAVWLLRFVFALGNQFRRRRRLKALLFRLRWDDFPVATLRPAGMFGRLYRPALHRAVLRDTGAVVRVDYRNTEGLAEPIEGVVVPLMRSRRGCIFVAFDTLTRLEAAAKLAAVARRAA